MNSLGGVLRRAMATVVILTSWDVWKEHNAIIFKSKFTNPIELVSKIKDEDKTWNLAEVKGLE